MYVSHQESQDGMKVGIIVITITRYTIWLNFHVIYMFMTKVLQIIHQAK